MVKEKIKHWVVMTGHPEKTGRTRETSRKAIKKLRRMEKLPPIVTSSRLPSNTYYYVGKVIGRKIILDL